MKSRKTAVVCMVLMAGIIACNAPSGETDIDATVNARVARTLGAVMQEGDGGEEEATSVSPANTVPAATYVPVSGDGPSIDGCPVFPADHIWNTPVDSLPVHPSSDAYIDSIGADTTLHPDFGAEEWEGEPIGIPYNVVDGSNIGPAIIEFYYPDESDAGPYPIPAEPLIEGAGDRHILLVDTSNCRLLEIFDAEQQDDRSWSAGSGAVWDLADYALRPEEWTSADAAGLPILPGLVRYDEIAAGEIRHAIRFTAEETQRLYVWPARHFASDNENTDVPPMGQRFRLKASFDSSSYPPDVQIILRAMQVYGIILADNGSNWYINGSPDPRWNDEELHEAFDGISGSDFEAVDVSDLMIDSDSGQAQQP
jgi:hypothetical protein